MTPNELKKVSSLLSKNKFLKTKDLCDKLLKKNPGNVDLLHFKGASLHKLGRSSEALLLLKKAHALSPLRADICNSIAQTCKSIDINMALEYQQKAVDIKPIAPHLSNLATLQGNLDYASLAVINAKRAVLQDENYIVGWKLLCHLLVSDGQFIEALNYCENIPVNDPDRLKFSAESYLALNNYELGLESVESLLALPNLADDYKKVIVDNYQILGEFERANTLFHELSFSNKTIEQQMKLKFGKLSKNEFDSLQSEFTQIDEQPETKRNLAFEIAAAFKKSDKKKWFHWLVEANEIELTSKKYDENLILKKFEEAINKIKSIESIELTSQSNSVSPIFVLGMPRSGTTLTESILGAHTSAFACGESRALGLAVNQEFNNELNNHERGFEFLKHLDKLNQPMLEAIAKKYIKKIRQHDKSSKHLVDKLPHNFTFLPILPSIFPKGKFIHVYRNPIANILSIFEQNFSSFHSYGENIPTLINYYKKYQEYVNESIKKLPKGSVYQLNYEALVTNTEEEVRKLLDYCELPFEQSCLEFNKQKRTVKTASVKQVRQGIYTSSLRPWEGLEEELKEVIAAFPDAAK